ncbi:MAG: lipopolysaccharide biosynthesis protein [Pseudaminobacter sp.]|nr:lipopolysaccharide biosynthesis protein [Pseudaminobacter sp.]
MTQIRDIPRQRPLARVGALLSARRGLLRDYFAAMSGAAGRLVFSLIYFVALANTLSISDFGLFATASAAGVMLSRILAFGFISALYRTATIRPNLIGVFTAGFLALALASLPILAAASYLVYLLFFANELALSIFAMVVLAEALFWRPFETVIIVNNGLGRFGRAAGLTIFGTLLRATGAAVFWFQPESTLSTWAGIYVFVNLLAVIVGFGFFYPRQRLRFRAALYRRRLADSLYVAGAEVLFYLQMEFDKLLVLALGGPTLAGIYAIVMRLVDLTAIPIRTFSMMLVQRMMRAPEMLSRLPIRIGIEAGIFVVSTAALFCLAVVLYFFPAALGRNVAQAASLIGLALCIPGLRNLVEYQAELLFARGQTLIRAVNLALLAGAKGVFMVGVMSRSVDTEGFIWSLNAVFIGLYILSTALTYAALRRPAKPV